MYTWLQTKPYTFLSLLLFHGKCYWLVLFLTLLVAPSPSLPPMKKEIADVALPGSIAKCEGSSPQPSVLNLIVIPSLVLSNASLYLDERASASSTCFFVY